MGRRSSGLDHGVFIPFRRMFGFETDIPIIEVSIDSSSNPEVEWKIGQILEELRYVCARDGVRHSLLIAFPVEGLREYCCSLVV